LGSRQSVPDGVNPTIATVLPVQFNIAPHLAAAGYRVEVVRRLLVAEPIQMRP
jgi:hypothetical protein